MPSREGTRAWFRDNDAFRRDILDLLGSSWPMTSREIPDTCVVPWASTGWTNNRNVTQMLECLMLRGEVAIAGRVARERLWDMAERVYRADVVIPSVDEARRGKNERRLSSLGIARQKSTSMPIEPVDLEMYKPATKRRWGSFALPILHDDRLVGKVDATADRKAAVLRVHAIHEDVKFTRKMTKAVQAELDDLASWLGLGAVEPAHDRASVAKSSASRSGTPCSVVGDRKQ